MTDREIIELCDKTLAEEFELDSAALTPETRFFEDLELDSLDAVDMIVALEQAFGRKLRDNEALRGMRALGDLHAYLLRLAKAPDPAEGGGKVAPS